MDVEFLIATIVAVLETLIILGLNWAVVEARRLRTWWHHFWIYTIYTVQGIIWILWMGAKAIPAIIKIFAGELELEYVPFRVVIHWIIGGTVIIAASTLVITFLFFPEINVSKMKRAKYVMRYVYVAWTINYIIGLIIYFSKYYPRPDGPISNGPGLPYIPGS